MTTRMWQWSGGVIGIILLIFLVLWGWVVTSSNPLQNPLADKFPWPVACTARGCITTKTWSTYNHLNTIYATSFKQSAADPSVILTTLIRQKLVSDATVKSAVTVTDAHKYRQEILHVTDDSSVQSHTGLTATDYDTQVVLPFLEQEALRQQFKAESATELYSQLSAERRVIVLLRAWRWDRSVGQVVAR